MRLSTVFSLFVVILVSSTDVDAALEIHEPFDYATTGNMNDGTNFGDGSQSGALGTTGAWSTLINNVEMEVRDEAMTFTDSGGNTLDNSGLSIRRSNRSGFTTNSISVTSAATTALTADNTTMWMSFLYEDEGFSGPDSSVMLASEPLQLANNHTLGTEGFGVGVMVGESAANTIETAYYNNSTTSTRVTSTVSPNDNENVTFMIAAKINWNPDGVLDEIFVFNITDLTTEPLEADAIASDTFDMPLTGQQSLDTLNIGETQVDAFDEIRFGTTFADVTPFTPGMSGTLGDFNDDNVVDLADYTIWRNNLGEDVSVLPDGSFDPNGSTTVDSTHYDAWRANFGAMGTIAASTAAVPEPSTIALVGLALFGLVAMRHSRG